MTNNGTWTGTASYAQAQIGFNQCGSFSSGNYITLPSGACPNSSGGSFTAEYWFKGSSRVLSIHLGGTGASAFYIANDTNGYIKSVLNTATLQGATNVCDSNWHKIALCVYAGAYAAIFVDGNYEAGSALTSYTGAAQAMGLGAANGGSFPTTGQIDEAALYNIALYACPYAPAIAPVNNLSTGIVALFHLDGSPNDSSGTVVNPVMGHIYNLANGTIVLTAGLSGMDTIAYPAAIPGSYPVVKYQLYQSTTQGSEALVQTHYGSGSGFFNYPSSSASTTNYYYVKAVDSQGNSSAASNEISVHVGSNGTVAGAGLSYIAGKFNQALSGFSTTSYVTLPDPGNFRPAAASAFTIEGWVQLLSGGASGQCVWYSKVGTGGIWVGSQTGKPACSIAGFGAITSSGSSIAGDGIWHHVAVSVTSSTATLYVDGTSVGSASGSLTTTTGVTQIGAYNATIPWQGYVCEISLSTVSQYSGNFTAPTTAFAGARSGQAALYHTNGTVGSIATGASVIDSDGMIVGPGVGTISVTQTGGNDVIAYSAPVAGDNTVVGVVLYKSTQPGFANSAIAATNVGTGSGTFTVASSNDGSLVSYCCKAYDNATPINYGAISNEVYAQGGSATAVLSATAPNSANLLQTPGNIVATSSYGRMVNSGAGYSFTVNASHCVLQFDMTYAEAPLGIVGYRVDGQAWVSVPLQPAITVFQNQYAQNRLVEFVYQGDIQYKNRWNDPPAGMLSFLGAYATATPAAATARGKNILVIGDSITEGLNDAFQGWIENTGPNGYGQVTNAWRAWPYRLGELLNANVGSVGFGSQGWLVNGNGNVPLLTTSYQYIYGVNARSFANIDMVVFNMGTNDTAQTQSAIQTAITTVCNAILTAKSTIKIVLFQPYLNNATVNAAIVAAVAAIGNSNVTYSSAIAGLAGVNLADSLHPLAVADINKIAPAMASVIQPILYPTSSATPVVAGAINSLV